MNLVDSSGWMEYWIEGPQAEVFSEAIEDTRQLIIPTVCLYEIFKKIIQMFDEKKALEAVSIMEQGRVVVFDDQLAVMSAKYSHELKLPMADSIILATARQHKAIIWTQDADFKDLPDVKYFPKK